MSLKVLIIDDEKDSCSLLNNFLTNRGYLVHTAFTLTDGMRLMDETKPDIIFLDNNLPDGFGWDKIDFIHEKLPSSKINLISAYKYIPGTIKENASVRLIEKPISFAALKDYL